MVVLHIHMSVVQVPLPAMALHIMYDIYDNMIMHITYLLNLAKLAGRQTVADVGEATLASVLRCKSKIYQICLNPAGARNR